VSRGDVAVQLLRAQLDGQDYPPPGVEDTPANHELWDEIAASIDALPPGVLPDVPLDYTHEPGNLGT
jgi:hypothetical protein